MGKQNKVGVGKKDRTEKRDPIDLVNLEERRQSFREPTFKAGEVILEDGTALDCVVRNVSDTGCLVKLENANALPEEIRIRIDLGKPPRQAQIIWRSTSLAGAMFTNEPN